LKGGGKGLSRKLVFRDHHPETQCPNRTMKTGEGNLKKIARNQSALFGGTEIFGNEGKKKNGLDLVHRKRTHKKIRRKNSPAEVLQKREIGKKRKTHGGKKPAPGRGVGGCPFVGGNHRGKTRI